MMTAELGQLRDVGVAVGGETKVVARNVPPQDRSHERFDGFEENRLEAYRQAINFMDQSMRRKQRGFPKTPVQILVPPVWRPARTE